MGFRGKLSEKESVDLDFVNRCRIGNWNNDIFYDE